MNIWHNKLSQLFFKKDISSLDWHLSLTIDFVLFSVLIVAAFIVYIITHKVLTGLITSFFQKTKNTWDNEVLKGHLLKWISLIIPLIILLKAIPETVITQHNGEPAFASTLSGGIKGLLVILVFLAINSLLNIIERIYSRFEVSRELPVKSFFQVIKIILLIATIIMLISIFIGKSPALIFSGLGAMTAIMMLIFKDSLLGLVAGIQLSANRMVARGDWIEMPKFGADGEVLEVALTTVKVMNWDKTITTIPTYALISDSFKNWRGMSNSGVRRIKRSVNIDMSTIGFLSDEMLQQLKQVNLLQTYLEEKEKEIKEWNTSNTEGDLDSIIDTRGLTNLGTFRTYLKEYLSNHSQIASNETLLVRQLQPTEYGIPIEIYVFTTDNRWAYYEDIQSDIFDHLLSILPEFGLRAFQRPSDHSFLQNKQH